jgi:hypothetical protein
MRRVTMVFNAVTTSDNRVRVARLWRIEAERRALGLIAMLHDYFERIKVVGQFEYGAHKSMRTPFPWVTATR